MRLLLEKALEPASWDYYEGGSDDEITVRANRLSFAGVFLMKGIYHAHT